MKPIILFRSSEETLDELKTLSNVSNVYTSRAAIPNNSLVVGRYSVLPFYKELETDLQYTNSILINSWDQHDYIADIERWTTDLKGLTPQTWFEWYGVPEGSYIVKGRTNSRKFQWKDQMFAETKADISQIAQTLLLDQLIVPQGLCVRKYIPLRRFDTAINGLPICNEWRVFFFQRNLLSYGFYWSNFEEHKPYEKLPKKAMELLKHVATIVSKHTNFYVVDIAECENGDWIVIELNDGQMSGLSMNDPVTLYINLIKSIQQTY